MEIAYHPQPRANWRPSTPPVTAANFDDVTNSHPTVAVQFWAIWNSHHDSKADTCIKEIVHQFDGRVHFVSCDTDLPENAELVRRLGVDNLPLIAVIVDGQRRSHIVGLQTPEKLAVELESRLLEPPFQEHIPGRLERIGNLIFDALFYHIDIERLKFWKRS